MRALVSSLSATPAPGAVEGTDYPTLVHTATIAAGATSTLVTIDPRLAPFNDTILEFTESVTLTLGAVVNVAPDAGSDITVPTPAPTATLTILDDDAGYVGGELYTE